MRTHLLFGLAFSFGPTSWALAEAPKPKPEAEAEGVGEIDEKAAMEMVAKQLNAQVGPAQAAKLGANGLIDVPEGFFLVPKESMPQLIAVMGYRSLPKTSRPTLRELVTALASPLGAMRAHDVLARQLFIDLEPLVAGGLLLTGRARERLCREVLVARPDDPGLARAVTEMGLDPVALLAPPRPDGPTSRAYCPVCLDQFNRADTACSLCGRVPVRPLPPAGP